MFIFMNWNSFIDGQTLCFHRQVRPKVSADRDSVARFVRWVAPPAFLGETVNTCNSSHSFHLKIKKINETSEPTSDVIGHSNEFYSAALSLFEYRSLIRGIKLKPPGGFYWTENSFSCSRWRLRQFSGSRTILWTLHWSGTVWKLHLIIIRFFFLCVEKYFPFSGTFMEHFFGYSATGFFFLGGKGEIFGTKNPPLPAATDYL